MATPLLAKHPSEAINVGLNFRNRLPAGATISSGTVTVTSGDVTAGAASVSGTSVVSRIGAGSAGTQSVLTFTATLSTTEVLYGILYVTPMTRDF